jgi:hypothetical protein
MSSDPDIRVRVQIRDVVIEVHSNRIEQRILDKTLLQTTLITIISTRVTIAHGRPSGSDLGTAAGEQKVIVQFVLLDGRTAVSDEPESRSSLNGNDYGAVVR